MGFLGAFHLSCKGARGAWAANPGIQVPGVARAVAINGTRMLVKVFSSQPALWGERKLVMKLITGRGGGGGGAHFKRV